MKTIEILVYECGAPKGTVVELQYIEDDGVAVYRWDGDLNWVSGLGKYRVLGDLLLIRNIAEQFVVLYEGGEKIDHEYFHSAFKDALGRDTGE